MTLICEILTSPHKYLKLFQANLKDEVISLLSLEGILRGIIFCVDLYTRNSTIESLISGLLL